MTPDHGRSIMTQQASVFEDRRRRRSEEPSTAIALQLEQVVDDFGLDCCIIVDADGESVASSPQATSPQMEAFAGLLPAICTVTGQREDYLRQLRRAGWDVDADELTGCVFRAGGRRMFIGAIGAEAVMNEVAIFRAITGARRIHGS